MKIISCVGSRLSDLCGGKDNNFNLIRILSAYGVLFSHSYPLSLGGAGLDPLGGVGMSIGQISVDVFFLVSGFLVTSSVMTKSLVEFFWARFLRIYPALWVMVFLVVFLVGPVFTSRSWSGYFFSSQTFDYFFYCSTLVRGVAYVLPGVFEENPFKGSVNGSLWTLPYEIKMYGVLVLVWFVLNRFNLKNRSMRAVLFLFFLGAGSAHLFFNFKAEMEVRDFRLFYWFFIGGFFYVNRSAVVLSWGALAGCVLVILLSASIPDLLFFVYVVFFPYVVICLAYLPGGWVRKYGFLSDYSYGVYIYAFPVQQSIVFLFPGISVMKLFFLSAILVVFFAALSWHFIEKPALSARLFFCSKSELFFWRAKSFSLAVVESLRNR